MSVHVQESPLNSRPPVRPAPANEPFKHVIDEYKHQAQTITIDQAIGKLLTD